MKHRILSATPLAALLLLAACNSQPETITAGDSDPDANTVAAAPPVKLPPAMLASKTYRCKDNSLVYVNWFNDNVTANIRTDKEGAPTALTAPAAGQPLTGGGFTVAGTPDAKAVTITRPGKPAQSCDA
ncbi:hypothetical protein [uncultured Sphingomonas sp.]|uniref:hypothetical protein n=1 Tax=uncultured Sphingomonas sp. TaxID=158754 RepID=UPI0025FEA18B|nr:hypothetical protein [uncultured Sphingomonas sp.]